MTPTRSRFLGTTNIIRFNRGKYAAAAIAVVALATAAVVDASLAVPSLIGIAAILIGVGASLGVSYWVYDASNLYDFGWASAIRDGDRVAVVHAGFDEVSETLQARHDSPLHTVSFYNRLEITEASIRRAQDHNDASAAEVVETGLPILAAGGFDWVVAFMCLHELRTEHARQDLLTELQHGLNDDGKLVVVEHLRDLPNAIAFSIGVFHFHTRSSWATDFAAAGLQIVSENKTTPFVTEFVLGRAPHT